MEIYKPTLNEWLYWIYVFIIILYFIASALFLDMIC